MENKRGFGIKFIAANLAFQQIAIIVITMLISLFTVLGTKVEAISQNKYDSITKSSAYKFVANTIKSNYKIYTKSEYHPYSRSIGHIWTDKGYTPFYIVPTQFKNNKYRLIKNGNIVQEIDTDISSLVYTPSDAWVEIEIEEWIPGLNKWISRDSFTMSSHNPALKTVKKNENLYISYANMKTDGEYVYINSRFKDEMQENLFTLDFLNGVNTVVDFSYNNSAEWRINGIKNPTSLTVGDNIELTEISIVPPISKDNVGSKLNIHISSDNGINNNFSIEISNGNFNSYKLTGNITKKTEKVKINNTEYLTEYEWGVKTGHMYIDEFLKENKLTIQLNDGSIYDRSVCFKDLTGCTIDTAGGDINGYPFLLYKSEEDKKSASSGNMFFCEGVIELQVMDGNGKWSSKKIHVVPTETNAVTNTINVPGDDDQSSQDSSQGGSQGGGQSTSVVKPTIGDVSTKNSGNKKTQTVSLYNATEALCFIAPTSWRYIQETYGYADYYDLYLSGKAKLPYKIVYDNPSSITFTHDIGEVPDGEYDFYVVAKNGTNEACSVCAFGPGNLGPSYGLPKPEFGKDRKSVYNNDEHSNIDYVLKNVKNTTEFKYKFYNMDVPAEKAEYERVLRDIHDIPYDKFNGNKTSNINNGEVKFNLTYNKAHAEGNYKIIVMGINTDSSVRQVEGYSVGKLEKAAPIIYAISFHTGEPGDPTQYGVINKEYNQLDPIVEEEFLIIHFNTKEEYEEANKQKLTKAELVKKYGEFKTYNNNLVIDPKVEGFQTGYYQAIVYAKNSVGKETICKSEAIYFGSAPEITYTIEGEPEGATSSIALKDKKTVKVKIVDKENETCNVEYFVSETCLMDENDPSTALTAAQFQNSNLTKDRTQYKKISNVKSGDEITITIEPTEGKDTNKYLYVYAKDSSGVYSIIQTGAIRVDGTKLELVKMYVADEVNEADIRDMYKKPYGVGSDLAIHLMFNHPILNEKLPDLYIIDKDRKQDRVEVDANEVIYHFIINENDPIKSEISYTALDEGMVKDTYTNQSSLTFDGENIVDEKNTVINRYLIDAEPPKIENISILVSADEEMIYTDEQTQNVFVPQCNEVKVKVVYDDFLLTGQGKDLILTKGNNKVIPIHWDEAARTEERGTTVDIYTVPVEEINNDETFSEGELKVERFDSTVDEEELAKDTAGNIINTDNTEANYILNDVVIESGKLFFDSSIYEPEIYLGENRIEKARGIYAAGSEFTLFAEFDKEENCADISGMKKVELIVEYKQEENEPIVKYKDGSVVETKITEELENNNSYYTIYNLDTEKLPITLKLDNKDRYSVVLNKTDNSDNSTQKKAVITIDDKVTFNKEISGLLNVEDNKNFSILSDEEKVYTLNLKLFDTTRENIKVHVNAIAMGQESIPDDQIDYAGKENIDGVEYDQYKFTIPSTGKYEITVTEKSEEAENLLTDYIEIYNSYTYGDINNDGVVSAEDLTYLLRYFAKRYKETEEIYQRIQLVGDIDGNGEVNVMDGVLMVRVIGDDPLVYRKDDGHFDEKKAEN